jgi:hypothetical protein
VFGKETEISALREIMKRKNGTGPREKPKHQTQHDVRAVGEWANERVNGCTAVSAALSEKSFRAARDIGSADWKKFPAKCTNRSHHCPR